MTTVKEEEIELSLKSEELSERAELKEDESELDISECSVSHSRNMSDSCLVECTKRALSEGDEITEFQNDAGDFLGVLARAKQICDIGIPELKLHTINIKDITWECLNREYFM